MNVELKLANDEQRVRPESSEVERLHASIQKAKEVLGWQPQLIGLEGFKAGLKQTIDWFSNPTNLARYKADRYNL
jgi:dTDP-glucose 4,6-dehydratase